MTKLVNAWNEWDPLKRLILGRPEGTHVGAPEPGFFSHQPDGGYPVGSYGPYPQDMVDEANEQMDNFVQILQKRGISVDRVEVHPTYTESMPIATPDWSLPLPRGTNCPRDLFMTVGNEIMEAPGAQRQRWFEYLNLRPIFERYFKEDPEFLWTAAPKPRLTNDSYIPNFGYNWQFVFGDDEKRNAVENCEWFLTDQEPMWDAAAAMRFGKDIFFYHSTVVNNAALDWLRRYFGAKGIRIHEVRFGAKEGFGMGAHIDVRLIPVRPGLVIHNPTQPILNEEIVQLFKMNDWEIVEAAPPSFEYPGKLDAFGLPHPGVSWISANTLSLGPNTICVEAHENRYIDQLTKMGIEVVAVPYDKVIPFGGSLHCTTVDVYREGKLEDYFPKQIPGL